MCFALGVGLLKSCYQRPSVVIGFAVTVDIQLEIQH